MKNAEKFIHPTKFTGNWPNWNGFAFLDWHKENNVYHPGEDYNFGYGDQDLGQDTNCTANGIVVHVSKRTTGYGNLIICKHNLGYNLRKFIKETYGIDTNKLYSLYAHLKDISVNVGDEIDCGQKIGTVGKSGTKWAHLHFEIFAPIGEIAKKAWRFYPVGWSKEKIGSHIIRNNVVFDCGQAGIVGSLGGVYSKIYNNHIYDIWTKRIFSGAEMAGIKIHASIDMLIKNNFTATVRPSKGSDILAACGQLSGKANA